MITRALQKLLLLGSAASALGSPLVAQTAPRIGIGIDVSTALGQTNGEIGLSFVGPVISTELRAWDRLRLRADASLLVLGSKGLDVVNPNQPDAGGGWTSYSDARKMRYVGTASLALEAGMRDRYASGGLFAAARLGGGVARWAPGLLRWSAPMTPTFEYRAGGRTAPVLVAGGEAGFWIPAFGRPNRFTIRYEGVHARGYSSARVAAGLLRNW